MWCVSDFRLATLNLILNVVWIMLKTWGWFQIIPKTLNCNVEKEVGQYLHWLVNYKPLKSCTITYDTLCMYQLQVTRGGSMIWIFKMWPLQPDGRLIDLVASCYICLLHLVATYICYI